MHSMLLAVSPSMILREGSARAAAARARSSRV
jgi:hypothetical protein